MARWKRMAAAAMIAAMAFAGAAYGSEICTFDAGYYSRLDGHGDGTVDFVRGKGEICIPGYPVHCVPAKRKGDIITGGGWTLKIDDEPGVCRVIRTPNRR